MLRPSLSLSSSPRAALALTFSAALAMLSACGGGGGDSAPATPVPSVVSQLVVTEANQQAVAAEAVQVTEQGTTTADVGSVLVTGAQVSAGARGPIVLGAVAQKLLAMVPQGPALATGVTETQTADCSGGGTVTVTAASSGTGTSLAVGDSIAIAARGCVEPIDGTNMRIDGSMSLTAIAGTFDSSSTVYPKDVTLRMVATNLSLDNVQMNGSLDLHLLQTSAVLGSVALTSPSFTWKVTTASGTQTLTLRDYSHRVDQATVDTASIQLSVTVETDNSRLGSGVTGYTISTPTPVVVNTLSGTGMLLSGSVKVTGKASALLITVTGNDTLQLQVDSNGDGTYDTSRTVSRFQL